PHTLRIRVTTRYDQPSSLPRVSQQHAQLLPLVVQIRTSRPARYTQHLSNFRVRKALDIMEHYHGARTLRKLRQGSLEPLAQLTSFRRIPERGRNRFRELLGISDLASPRQI